MRERERKDKVSAGAREGEEGEGGEEGACVRERGGGTDGRSAIDMRGRRESAREREGGGGGRGRERRVREGLSERKREESDGERVPLAHAVALKHAVGL